MTKEEAAKEIRKRHCTENKFCHDDCMYSENACPYDMAIEALKEPEIVHCKDCKYWLRTRIGEEELNQCGLAGYLIGGRGYCLYGKAGEQE